MENFQNSQDGGGPIPIEYCTHCGAPVQHGAAACMKCGCPPATGRGYCRHCGAQVGSENQVVCVNCGAALNFHGGRPVSEKGKSATVAVILSCLWSGLGQLYLGQIWKGVVLMILYVFCCSMVFPGLILWIVSMVDAHHIGKKLERGQPVGEWEFF